MPANNTEIEKRLWDAADDLRANSKLKSSEYSMPVLGLIFLRYADYKFTQAEAEINVKPLHETAQQRRRKIGKLDYQARDVMYLPDEARFSRLLNLPEGAAIAKAIEKEYEALSGVLPKNYAHLDKSLLVSLLKSLYFDLSKAAGDVFGKIYEYFLGKFAMSEGQKGGEFFTRISLVTLIVEIIEPYHGFIFDPAHRSGGMFVQSAKFVERHKQRAMSELTIAGQEKVDETVRLCRMNLAVHGLEGNIRQGNTYYEDIHKSVGKFDFVMANPPFNVDKVDKEKLKGDPRFPLGLPSNDNANYLWIQIFYSGVHHSDRPFFVIDTAFYLKPIADAFDLKWEYYQLRNFDINSLDSGSAIPSTSREAFYQDPVDLPSLTTQCAIASILSAYDDLIENNARRIKILEQMAQAIYREWFVEFRAPGVKLRKATIDEKKVTGKDQFQVGWEIKRLGDMTAIFRGKSYRSSELVDEGWLPFLNLKCIDRGGGFRYDGVKRFQGEYKDAHVARTGDFIVAVTDMTQERRLVAHAARVHIIDNDFAIMSMDLIRIEPVKRVAKGYLHGLLRFSNFPDEVKQHANGVNVLHLNPSQIENFLFAMPASDLRDRYAEISDNVYRQCDVLQAKNRNLRRTRDLLLPRLISGEIMVES